MMIYTKHQIIWYAPYKLITCNKTMQNQTQQIASMALRFIMEKFNEELKVHHLLQHANEYNAFMHQMLTYELVYAAQFPSPNRRMLEIQQKAPNNIELDHNANFMLEQISILQPEQPQILQQVSLQQKKSKRIKRESSIVSAEFYKGVFELSEPVPNPVDNKLEQQIVQIKKKLNFMRRIKKESEDEQRRRYDQILNRKHLQLPGKQYAYDFNGSFLFTKRLNFKNSLLIVPNGKSQELSDIMSKQKNKQSEEDSQRDMLISRGQGGSREGKRLLFGNSGKRQLSNLPFIKLSDNIKLTQSHRSAAGPDSSRYTLKSYHSRGQSTFKSFAEIEKERTQRMYSLKRSSKFSELTEEDVQDKPATTQVEIRKQSKRMQKYLKRLSEDRSKDFVIQLNKSSNFQRLNSPHDYSIHRYYKHNFDDDKKSICDSSLVSLRLNNSHFQEVKYQ